MLCPKCGTEISDGFRFCTNCGEPLTKPEVPAALRQIEVPPCPQTNVEQQPAFPMKWFHFLIYFALFAAAAIEFVVAICCFTGLHHGSLNAANEIYESFPAWRTLDIILGGLLVFFTTISIYTRFRLSGYHKDGLLCLYLNCVAGAVFWLVQMIGVMIVISGKGYTITALSFLPLLGSLLCAAVVLTLHWIYFNRRKGLFHP